MVVVRRPPLTSTSTSTSTTSLISTASSSLTSTTTSTTSTSAAALTSTSLLPYSCCFTAAPHLIGWPLSRQNTQEPHSFCLTLTAAVTSTAALTLTSTNLNIDSSFDIDSGLGLTSTATSTATLTLTWTSTASSLRPLISLLLPFGPMVVVLSRLSTSFQHSFRPSTSFRPRGCCPPSAPWLLSRSRTPLSHLTAKNQLLFLVSTNPAA